MKKKEKKKLRKALLEFVEHTAHQRAMDAPDGKYLAMVEASKVLIEKL